MRKSFMADTVTVSQDSHGTPVPVFSTIRKRDGRVVPFDVDKITAAIL